MKVLNVYVADDGTKFINEKICLEYEEERAKHPDDPGIRFYNSIGEEIDINHISSAVYYVVTNSIIANARYNTIRMQCIKQNVDLPIEVGHYTITGKDVFKLSSDLFDEILSRLNHKE